MRSHGRFLRQCAVCLAIAGAACSAWSAQAIRDPMASLRDKHTALEQQLQRNPFGRPLVLESTESPNRVTGEIYAVLPYPFAQVRANLNRADQWCDVISLHINTKYCRPASGPAGTMLRVHVGKKTPEELGDAARVDFAYRVGLATPEYFDIALQADTGPMGTSDYRIALEAVELPNAQTFLHLTYSYAFNFAGKLAMQTYLATLARDKIGFTPVGQPDYKRSGQAGYVGGMRGLVERNAMRYYLAIDAFLESYGGAPEARFERRLQSWFTATEQYPRQLRETDRAAYMQMKRAENLRQQTVH